MYRFLIVIEKIENNYSAYVPDLPGCIATGTTKEDAGRNMHEALDLHIKGLLENGLAVPEPTASSEYYAVM